MNSNSLRSSLLFLISIVFLDRVNCYPEQGIWNFEYKGNDEQFQTIVVTKSLSKKGSVVTSVLCTPPDDFEDRYLNVTWYLRKASCWKEYYESGPVPATSSPTALFQALGKMMPGKSSTYSSGSEIIRCDGTLVYFTANITRMKTKSDVVAGLKQARAAALVKNGFRKKREAEVNVEKGQQSDNVDVDVDPTTDPSTTPSDYYYDDYDYYIGEPFEISEQLTVSGSAQKTPLFVVSNDGIYQLIIGTKAHHKAGTIKNESYTAKLHVELFNTYGYLSAADYPLLIFYSTMCVIYVFYGVGWLIVSFMRWRELLRVQYWIGAVILLGMLEKAVFTAEYETVNKEGNSVPGLIVFAELVSCAKRTLSRMLVIIVSFGFGIVKPRLGVVLHRVIGVGSLYFLLASVEGCMRALRPKLPNDDYSRRLLFAIIPLALLESAICWWVFSALVSTTRTLRLRRNIIKLDLFKHFTNTLVFAVVTSVIFMLWSIKYRNFDDCLSDWKQLWVNDAFWHVLFAIILMVIMILWRPTNNNQRFAFSPLLDEGSDGEIEEHEKLMSNVSENMKFRSSKNSTGSSPKSSHSLEDDLRWVEENIPSSLADTGLPIMDSDEEILTTRFEISKMQ